MVFRILDKRAVFKREHAVTEPQFKEYNAQSYNSFLLANVNVKATEISP